METNDQILDKIKAVVKIHFSDAEIMLFGSRARKDSDSDSDFDILIITSKNLSPKNKTPLKTQIRKDLLSAGIRSDILIQSEQEIDKKKRLPGHLIKNILKEAIIL